MGIRFVQDDVARGRRRHVRHGNRDAVAAGPAETERLHVVQQLNGATVAHALVAREHQVRQVLLGQFGVQPLIAVAQRERQHFVENQAARGGDRDDRFEALLQRFQSRHFVAKLVLLGDLDVFDARFPVAVIHFGGIAEDRAADTHLHRVVEANLRIAKRFQ